MMVSIIPVRRDEEGGAFELGTDGPKVILVGVDDSVTSLRAAAYAARAGPRQGARLVVVYVEQLSAMYGAAAGLPGAGPACWDLCWYLALNRVATPNAKKP